VSAALNTDAGIRESVSRDASGLRMVPDSVARPASGAEVAELLRDATGARTPVTAAGAQTSTTGASITDRGTLLSLRGLDRILDVDVARRVARVECGVRIGELQRAVAAEGLMFAPDPTSEEECTVGGAIACNASGARSLRYGVTRAHVAGVTVALASGQVVTFRRSRVEKNTVGYYAVQDPVDWFVGSEGTLGVVTEAELALIPLPARVTGMAIPFVTERDALAFVIAARESALAPRCLEYFDTSALALARTADGDAGWARTAGALVYTEDASDAPDAPLDAWLALIEAHAGLPDDLRVFEGDAALRNARRLRHAVPAGMHERAAPYLAKGGRRVSTDWAVPYPLVAGAIARSRAIAERAGVEPAVTYGHAGNGHPHQNYVATDPEHLARLEQVVEATLIDVIAHGGTVAAEHGIGKLKRKWVGLQLSALQIGVMQAIKTELDPLGILAPGNVL
jgi:FAD/FMN-containing dehydrogenase